MSEASEPFIDPLLGATVGAYAIEERIGEGGMAVVYRARDPRAKRPIALKVFQRAWAQDPRVVRRFVREARIASTLDNPNTVAIHDFGEADGGVLYIAMELLEGRPLRELIAERKRLAPPLAAEIAAQICRSLVHAHEHGIVHRDLKPDNVYLTLGPNGELVCKVLDYGVARVVAPDSAVPAYTVLTQIGTILGTPGYMAPEQARAEEVDARTDLYSLGVMLFEMLEGRLPFFDKNPIRLLELHKTEPAPTVLDAPALLGELVGRMLAKAPDDRPSSATQVLAVLEAYLVTASPESRRLAPGDVRDERPSASPRSGAPSTGPDELETVPAVRRTPKAAPSPSVPATRSELDAAPRLAGPAVLRVPATPVPPRERERPSRTGPFAALAILALGVVASIAIAWSQRTPSRPRSVPSAHATNETVRSTRPPPPTPQRRPRPEQSRPEQPSPSPSADPDPAPEQPESPVGDSAASSPVGDSAASSPVEDWSGSFRTQEGMLRLTQSGDRIIGLFGRPGRMGRLWGRVEGGAIEFRWVIRGTDGADDEQGRGRLRRVETEDGSLRMTASLGRGDSVTGLASWNIWPSP